MEEKRKEAERLQRIANQKRLEAQQARQRALEQKEIAQMEAKRATIGTYSSFSVHPRPLRPISLFEFAFLRIPPYFILFFNEFESLYSV